MHCSLHSTPVTVSGSSYDRVTIHFTQHLWLSQGATTRESLFTSLNTSDCLRELLRESLHSHHSTPVTFSGISYERVTIHSTQHQWLSLGAPTRESLFTSLNTSDCLRELLRASHYSLHSTPVTVSGSSYERVTFHFTQHQWLSLGAPTRESLFFSLNTNDCLLELLRESYCSLPSTPVTFSWSSYERVPFHSTPVTFSGSSYTRELLFSSLNTSDFLWELLRETHCSLHSTPMIFSGSSYERLTVFFTQHQCIWVVDLFTQ